NLEAFKANYNTEDYQDILIRPFFHGNQYFLFVTETYNDIRLVGAPPSSIGKFGADTDNWEWPRHTGDFSLFRIYAGKDNKPADFSADNVPFKPRHHLPVSMDGVEADDFTLVFGFPGRTDEYLPAVAMEQRVNVLNPIRIGIRDKSLAILDEAMRNNPEARIQYASKQARIANGWKKWIGESQGIEATDGIGRRKQMETKFRMLVKDKPEWQSAYGNILPQFNRLYQKIQPFAESRDYINEIMYRNVELFQLTATLRRIVKIYENNGIDVAAERIPRVKAYLESFYKNYNAVIDQEIAETLLQVYYTEVTATHQAPYATDQLEFAGDNVEVLAQTIYAKSFLTKSELALKLINENPEGFIKQLQGDYAYQFVTGILEFSKQEVFDNYNSSVRRIEQLQRKYIAALMEVFSDRRFYPDANSTMRVTYGKVDGYSVGDTLQFDFSTYLDGVIEKYVPGDYEFDVPEKLRELHDNKDYGPYTDEAGRVPVCFLGSNHTTGGNSGSPAIDANGNLIGLNFDRTWHGTMSDINYDAKICRNIMVDARYILFIIDKFAGAGHLVEEMTLVHPKKED
ncbi:MAG: S46 family peptidase, partial [Bacteroidota bacterium]